MRRLGLALWAVIVWWMPALAAPEVAQGGGGGGVAGIRSAAVFVRLREAYRERAPFVEEVRVRVRGDGQSRAGTMRVFVGADGAAAVELGAYLVNFVGGRTLMAHELDVSSYVEICSVDEEEAGGGGAAEGEGSGDEGADPVGADPLGAGSEGGASEDGVWRNAAYDAAGACLPPLDAVTLALVFGRGDALADPLGHASGVEWDEQAVVRGDRRVVRGAFAGGRIEMEVDAGAWVVRRVRVRYGDGAGAVGELTIEQRVVGSGDAVDPRRWLIDRGRRRALAGVGGLRARAGDVRAGALLPALPMQDPGVVLGLTRRADPSAPRPGVLVVFGVEAVERAGAVLSEVEERGISGLGLAVVDVGDGGASVGEALRRVFEGLGRRSFGFSIEPRRTLRRFGSEGSCFAVAVDARGVVRRVERVRASGEAPAAVAAAVDALGGAGGG